MVKEKDLTFKLTEDFIQIIKEPISSYEEAIKIASKPLIDKKYIKPFYVNSMINAVKDNGPYIVVATDIALPHARPINGSEKLGFSVTIFDHPVIFSEEKSVHLLIVLSGLDPMTHIALLKYIALRIDFPNKMEQLIKKKSKKEILKLFKDPVLMEE
jgi:mannitol operon transcriptional antiterminator